MGQTWSPDELSEMLKSGEITKEQAVELLDQRVREQAFSEMNEAYTQDSGPRPHAGRGRRDDGRNASRRLMTVTMVLIFVMLGILVIAWMVARQLAARG